MAVKKHELVADDRNQLDLTALAQYFQTMNEQPSYLPSTQDLIKHCQDIVKCLARTSGTVEQLWQLLQPVEDFLLRVVTTVHCDVRHDIFTAIMDKLYSLISDPQSDACPAAATVLVVIDQSDEKAALSSARWLVQRTENDPTDDGRRAALACLYRWLHDWHSTPALGFWILAYIKALEASVHHDILIETSLDNLARLFSCLADPTRIHQNTANVIFHILASLRESVEAFDRISSMVGDVLVNLASDSGQQSRQRLQDLVDILTDMVDRITTSFKGDAQEMFRNKYVDVILCLEQHMSSRASKFLQTPAWRAQCPAGSSNTSMQKVGLLNLGNTCYMNSVIQALLVNRQFSTHAVLSTLSVPYWEKLAELFAHMMYSDNNKFNPDKFLKHLMPPFFTLNNQHDSSEFLGYLLELLQSCEHYRDRNYDYSRPPILNADRLCNSYSHVPQLLGNADDDDAVPGPSRPSGRSCSSRAGSSSSGSSSSGLKRIVPDNEASGIIRKRQRISESSVLRRDSVIDSLFGGVSLTRVQCNVCRACSLSRDVFRDLQLAFPEKPEGRQHSVQSLLDYYCSHESLSGDNRYMCRDCGVLRDAERRVLVETTPKYLILVLKNFKFDVKLQLQTKLMHSVYYNHTVTLPTPRAQAGVVAVRHATYNLFAAVIHTGTCLDHGHYYTLAKDNDQWHEYNDCSVRYTDDGELNRLNRNSTPYILFYRRTDIEETVAPPFEQLPRKLRDAVTADNKMYAKTARRARPSRL